MRSVLLRLAGPGAGESVVRRRVPLAEFDAERNADVARVLDVLADRRLLTVSEGTVEVAHEALLREWPRFQEWLEEDREGRRLHAHLTATAREWGERGQDPAELYRGARLSAALDWTTQHTLDLNELEREFVNASRVENERDLVEQRRRNRRLRLLLAGTGALLLLAIVAGGVALGAACFGQEAGTSRARPRARRRGRVRAPHRPRDAARARGRQPRQLTPDGGHVACDPAPEPVRARHDLERDHRPAADRSR